MLNIDWKSINPLRGDQKNAFEELCCQLARNDRPDKSEFRRKGTPDAGVECYAILEDGSEWGWQAKYFDTLGDSQWQQIDKSVKTAIKKHPKLVKYFICVPYDRPDARIPNETSAMQKWDIHVEKWKGWASKIGMSVDFEYWGSSELLTKLFLPENSNLLKFWFETTVFDKNWFTARFKESEKAAGGRYSPEVHVNIPFIYVFEKFCRSKGFFEKLIDDAWEIRKASSFFQHSKLHIDSDDLNSRIVNLENNIIQARQELEKIVPSPTGDIPFLKIAEQFDEIVKTAEQLNYALYEYEDEQTSKQKQPDENDYRRYQRSPIEYYTSHIRDLVAQIENTRDELKFADTYAGSSVLILKGEAGTGKTHLLCDLTKKRIQINQPTVLLMGQRFTDTGDPWSQILHMLDLANYSAEEFIGCLETAAKISNVQALVIIDALNEGKGKDIWPDHLASFLEKLNGFHWIKVILSIRSSYEDIVIPEIIQKNTVNVTHTGFDGIEYDATKTFFSYYGIEFPSTPINSVEFRNPLFLTLLCKGLKNLEMNQFPRGFHGITKLFNFCVEAANKKLARQLGYHQSHQFVGKALSAIAEVLTNSDDSWLSINEAEEIVNAFLPNRNFDNSLYHGLVLEGLLIEEGSLIYGENGEEVVRVVYERFMDHLVVKYWLDTFLDPENPETAFANDGPLGFVFDRDQYVLPGRLEALCVQIPERIGRELLSLAPNQELAKTWGIKEAFRESLIWRDIKAFSKETLDVLNCSFEEEYELRQNLNIILTLTSIPKHPLNALFLDEVLRKYNMPERDSWWSTFLFKEWGNKSSVDRLVDWAWSNTPETYIDNETVELCAISLAWMFTTSHRFLRDRATKALVSLLTGRFESTLKLVNHFANIDDPYIAERVYAVAYGVATRSHDSIAVGELAESVYSHVFTNNSPPPHILLRDYARGIIERAIYLGSSINIIVENIRPPYKSEFPKIPSEEDIKPLLPELYGGTYVDGQSDRGRSRIIGSIKGGDFALYVIGTNSSFISKNWLKLKLDEPPWKPPLNLKDQLNLLSNEFSIKERNAWESFDAIDKEYNNAKLRSFQDILFNQGKKDEDDISKLINGVTKPNSSVTLDIEELEKKRQIALSILEETLSEEHSRILKNAIFEFKKSKNVNVGPPGFSFKKMQRYILWRVFDLGWRSDLFDDFDCNYVKYNGRKASKPERIGKKYQWIAYHEILAFISDHYHYRDRFFEEEFKQKYEGPWQIYGRNIDPSCIIKQNGGTSWGPHNICWWGKPEVNSWGEHSTPQDWIFQSNDLPNVEKLLKVTNPLDDTKWINAHGFFIWKNDKPIDTRSTNCICMEIWYMCHCYLIKTEDVQSFMKWAEGMDFMGRWMPEAIELDQTFLGEYLWSQEFNHFEVSCLDGDGWIQPENECPVKIKPIATKYNCGTGGFDCSMDDGYRLNLPCKEIVDILNLKWSGNKADFVNSEGKCLIYDPTAHGKGPDALLIRDDALKEIQKSENYSLVWTVLGEKQVYNTGFGPNDDYYPRLRISGAYALGYEKLEGFIRLLKEEIGPKLTPLKIIRTTKQ